MDSLLAKHLQDRLHQPVLPQSVQEDLPAAVATAALVQCPMPLLTGFVTVVRCQTGATLLARVGNREAAVRTGNPSVARHVSTIKNFEPVLKVPPDVSIFSTFLKLHGFNRCIPRTIASDSDGGPEAREVCR